MVSIDIEHKNAVAPNYSSGFTLIELSIVLVVIGLIVGGVLVGQDLIRAAEIRSTLTQIEKFNTAVNTFYGKYSSIPGDMSGSQAALYGFFNTGFDGTTGNRNGNFVIECGDNANPSSTCAEGEILLFWRDLSDAGLTQGSYGVGLDSGAIVPSTVSASGWLPEAKLGRGNYFIATNNNAGINYYVIQGVGSLSNTGEITLSNALTPLQTRAIDVKLDDGLPLTGNILATDSNTVATHTFTLTTPAATDGAGNCALTGASITYDIGPAGRNYPACGMAIKMN